MAFVCITILVLTFISSSYGRHYSEEIEARLMYQQKIIENLLGLLQQPCYLINPTELNQDTPSSIMAMTIQQRMSDPKTRRHNHVWRKNPEYRFANDKNPEKPNNSKAHDFIKEKTGPEFDDDFYKALSKVLKMEISRRPELKKAIGDDMKKINIGDPDLEVL